MLHYGFIILIVIVSLWLIIIITVLSRGGSIKWMPERLGFGLYTKKPIRIL